VKLDIGILEMTFMAGVAIVIENCFAVQCINTHGNALFN
jgi:hypothetical protein